MHFSEKLYNNKKSIFIILMLFLLFGIAFSYFAYGTEPWETVGGFICGLSLGIAVVAISLKKPQKN